MALMIVWICAIISLGLLYRSYTMICSVNELKKEKEKEIWIKVDKELEELLNKEFEKRTGKKPEKEKEKEILKEMNKELLEEIYGKKK